MKCFTDIGGKTWRDYLYLAFLTVILCSSVFVTITEITVLTEIGEPTFKSSASLFFATTELAAMILASYLSWRNRAGLYWRACYSRWWKPITPIFVLIMLLSISFCLYPSIVCVQLMIKTHRTNEVSRKETAYLIRMLGNIGLVIITSIDVAVFSMKYKYVKELLLKLHRNIKYNNSVNMIYRKEIAREFEACKNVMDHLRGDYAVCVLLWVFVSFNNQLHSILFFGISVIVIPIASWFVYYLLFGLFLFELSHSAEYLHLKVIEAFQDRIVTMEEGQIDKTVVGSFEMTLRRMIAQPFSMNAKGFFSLNRSTWLSLNSFLVTIGAVVYQYRN